MKLDVRHLYLRMSRTPFMRVFSIVTFLLAITLYIARPEWTRRHLISEISDNGGSVTYDESLRTLFHTQRVVHVNLPERAEISVNDLRVFPHLDTLALPGFVYSQQGIPGKVVMRIEDVELLYEIMPKNT
jgi:hypothetical protein